MSPLRRRIATLLHPLADFYPASGVEPPHVEPLRGDEVPPPYRDLLVHDRDMTSTLARYWGAALHLRVIDKLDDAAQITRQVVLLTDGDERPVEFGAIKIRLDLFPPGVRDEIAACRRPLGAILETHGIRYACRPNAFFSFRSDAFAERAFGLASGRMLYGRHNLIVNDAEATYAEVVEILPPIDPAPDGAP
ncbi:MAG: hypothetical protein ACYTG1_05005 [Planctomycetota bacterium]|jgi:hypothetical protein